MQYSRKLKGSFLVLLLVAVFVFSTACTQARIGDQRIGGVEHEYSTAELSTGTHYIEGYIAGYDQAAGTVVVDPVEFLTTSHHDRITALGLDASADFHRGYYINNVSENDTITLKLASNLKTRFAHNDYKQTQLGLTGELAGDIREGADRAENSLHKAVNDTADALHRAGNSVREGVDEVVDPQNDSLNDSVNRSTINGRTTAITDHHDGVLIDISNGIARALGGVAGGITGGLEMLGERFMDGKDLTGYTPYFITIKDGQVTSIEEVHAYSNFALNDWDSTLE